MRPADLRQYVHALSGSGAFLLYYLPPVFVAALVGGGVLLAALIGFLRQRNGTTGTAGAALPTALHRPQETALRSGATTYGIGVMGAILLFPPEAAFVGWITLAAGDSAATLAGSRWPVLRFGRRNRRSLGGLLGFAAATGVALILGLAWWHGGGVPAHAAAIAAVAVVCAAVESFLSGIDDNLYLPALAAAVYAAF